MASSSDLAGALAAIEARLVANWTTTPIAYDNVQVETDPWPPVDTDGKPQSWVYVELIDVAAQIVAFGIPGNQTVLDTGLIKLHVMVQKGDGLVLGRQYAVQLGEIFRQQKFYDSDPTAYLRTTTPRVGRDSMVSDNGNWISVSCTVPYEFYHQA